MQENQPETPVPVTQRRSFLRAAAWGGGIAGLGGLAGLAANRMLAKRTGGTTPKPPMGDAFTYDVARFQKSDPALVRFEEIARFPAGLERARNITACPDGSMIVCGTGGIRKLADDGRALLEVPLPDPVYSTAVLTTGGILAGRAGKITRISPQGEVIEDWGAFSNKLLPTSIAAAGERILVADAGERVVLVIDKNGKTMARIGGRDEEKNIRGFVIPSPYFCVRMAPDGLLRVTNPGEHLIEAFTMDGDLEQSWGKGSFAVEGFCGCCNPVSFDIFPDGSYVTCEKGLPRVKLYDSHGGFTGLVAGPEAFPEYLKEANAGTPHTLGSGIYAAITNDGRVLVLDVVGGTIRIMKRKD